VLNTDASIIGTPFYVMEMVEGRIFKNPALPELRYSKGGLKYIIFYLLDLF
jgi:aminoglycoside phosphotransferase (APT) family kinase protein